MLSFDLYKKLYGGRTQGQVRKDDSDLIMNATWWEDIDARVGYLYDVFHDADPNELTGLKPEKDIRKIPIDIKYIQHSEQTYEKDRITYHLQLRPGQQCNVPYYKDYVEIYGSEFPIGLYCDIQNEAGIWNRWFIVDKANGESTQFPTYEILKCDYTFQYVFEHKKYSVAGVLRSQNSYNSGVWFKYLMEYPEDQQKFIIPLNRETEHLYYNQRIIIDAPVLTEPRAWRISKINRVVANGIAMFTVAQDRFDQHKDYIEKDEHGNVIGMWASFYDDVGNGAEAEQPVLPGSVYSIITCSGKNTNLAINGNFKKLTVTFYDEGEEMEFQDGEWKFTVDGEDATPLLEIVTSNEDTTLTLNQIKIRFVGDDSYIEKKLEISYESINKIKSSITLSLLGL